VAALFVLQAPLCAHACSESAKADPSSIAEQSCHEDGSDSSPAGQSNSHEDCECSFAAGGLVSQPIASISSPTSAEIGVSPALPLEPTCSTTGQELLVAQNTDLPPPDILLLKSTLII
jgi:hypothetical protein